MQNYIREALRTESPITDSQLLVRLTKMGRALHGILGLETELGEFVDPIKRHIFYGTPIDGTHIKEEFGDLLWYIAILMDFFGVDFESCMVANIDKLRARYPNKFTHMNAVSRDLPAERKVLEGFADPPALGRIAYEGYCVQTEGRSLVSHELLPEWDSLGAKYKAAWDAASSAVQDAMLQRIQETQPASVEFYGEGKKLVDAMGEPGSEGNK